MPKVFISYSHDSPEHSARVLELANALLGHGVDAELDQYHVRPEHGWPHWCEEQLREENAEFVLLVCTETYRERVENKVAADEGRGVYWEGAIIYDYLYEAKGNRRFIPILVDGAKSDCVPRRIRNHTHYSIAAFNLEDGGYQRLYRELTQQPAVVKPTLGETIPLGPAPSVLSPLPVREVKTPFGSPARPSALSAGGASLANPSLLALLEGLAARTRRKAAADNAVLVNRGQIQVPWKIMRHGPGVAVLRGARFAGPEYLPSVLTSSPSRQLVIVGDPGSGKSVMAEQLILELLAHRLEGDRVPVLFPLSSWNPRVESLSDWILNHLIEEDEEVAAMVARAGARDVGGTLVQQWIFPVLDGFDEIPEELRWYAVEGLNNTLNAYGLPVVFTCRTEDFERVRGAREILPTATVLSIGSLDPDTVRSYLLSPTQGKARFHWKRVFNALDAPGREPDGGGLVDVLPSLTSPLMAWLASTVYSGGATAAVAFTQGIDVAGPESLEKHLLAALVPEVFRRGIASPDGRPVRRTDPEDAERWLTFLARSLPPEGLRQISWWKIPDLAPMRHLALIAGAGGGLVFGVIAGYLPGLALSSAHSLAFSLFFGCGYGAAYSAARAKGVAQDGRTGYGGRVPGADTDTVTYARLLAFGLVPVLLFWIALSVLYPPVAHDVSRVLVAVGCGVVAATVIGLVGGTITGVILRSAKGFDAAVAGARAASPPVAVRRDRGATIGAAVLATLVSGCIAAFTTHAAYGLGFVPGSSGGFVGAVPACMVFNAWPVFRLIHVWLAAKNKLPWRLIAFLEESRRYGVLRQEGISYTFRHLRLLESLAEPRKTR